MNIFILDQNPAKAAEMLCDCHLRKMCVETAQILSGVMIRKGLELYDTMPKPQNINHPVIVAADADNNALDWVINYNHSLLKQFYFRFGKTHTPIALPKWIILANCGVDLIPAIAPTLQNAVAIWMWQIWTL